MQRIIIYGSEYGTTRRYAEKTFPIEGYGTEAMALVPYPFSLLMDCLLSFHQGC